MIKFKMSKFIEGISNYFKERAAVNMNELAKRKAITAFRQQH